MARSHTDPERKVWVATIPEDYEYLRNRDVDGFEVLIEQFGDGPPTIAFRPNSGAVWAYPIPTREGHA